MSKALRSVLVTVLVLGVGSTATTSISAQKKSRDEQIRELLELTGSGELGVQMMEGMIGPMREAVPDVPAEWWDRFLEKADAESINDLVVPIYDKHLTDEELDKMLEFYRSPVGRSIVKKMPAILQESMAVGQAWGVGIMEEILEELKQAGYELPPGLQS